LKSIRSPASVPAPVPVSVPFVRATYHPPIGV
jgi:hypothetical protein